MTDSFLVVGLGNPGLLYALHRHNVGFMLVDRLNQMMQLQALSRKEGEVFKGTWQDFQVMTLKPQTFMNLSGQAVQALMTFYKIPLSSLYVIHDDLDLQPGDVRFKRGGSDGGHNGLRSITAHIGAEYARLRIGIGRPSGPKGDITPYVLGNFFKMEQERLFPLLDRITTHWAKLWQEPTPTSFLSAIQRHS